MRLALCFPYRRLFLEMLITAHKADRRQFFNDTTRWLSRRPKTSASCSPDFGCTGSIVLDEPRAASGHVGALPTRQ
jgi:hypothetical protein